MTSKRTSKSGKVVKEVSLTTIAVQEGNHTSKTNFEKRQSSERSITNHYSSAGREPCSENVKDVKTTVEAPKSGKVVKEVLPTTIAVQEGKLCSENVKDVKTSDEASKSGKVLNDVSPTTIAVQVGEPCSENVKDVKTSVEASKSGKVVKEVSLTTEVVKDIKTNFEKRQSSERSI
ncbi:hypothetical protein CEXT_269861 [Caerostris extrusa]|uniref:Uncharacterized protein n=1 Tax=Caerostris extrusa TaxID=172846 RepID=A0AAV4NF08_CAEEX|nr:hypothetical protein CEXT_269861 [Caerostris extrusa]